MPRPFDREGSTYQWEELVYLAELELRAGNWDLAARYASEGLESTVETGLEEAREVHLWSTALVAAHRGDIETARANASEGLRIAEAHGDVFHVVTNRSALGFLELSLGNAQDAHGWLGPLVELTDRWGLRQPSVFPFLPDEIEALVTLGDLDAAAALLNRLETQGQALGSALALATGARCRASLAAASQDPEQALDAIEEALAYHKQLPQPFDLARTHLTAGEILRRSKKKAAAREHLERALGIFEELGAQIWSARAREALSRVGGRAPSPTELTETERKVAELVGTGKTNAGGRSAPLHEREHRPIQPSPDLRKARHPIPRRAVARAPEGVGRVHLTINRVRTDGSPSGSLTTFPLEGI